MEENNARTNFSWLWIRRDDQDFSDLQQRFADSSVRRYFLIWINFFLLTEYSLTFVIMAYFHFTVIDNWFAMYEYLWYTLFGLLGIMIIIIVFGGTVRWKSPWCYFFWFYVLVVTSTMFASLGTIIGDWSFYTIVVVVGLAILGNMFLALIPETKRGTFGILYVFVLFLTLAWLCLLVFWRTSETEDMMIDVMVFAYSNILAFFIAVDMHLMVTGKHYYQITPEDYTVAMTHLFMDPWTCILVWCQIILDTL